MDWEKQKKRMADAAFKKFGVDGLYKSKLTGVPGIVRVIVKHDVETNPDILISGVSEPKTILSFKTSEVSDPRVDDTVIIDGEKFILDKEFKNNRIAVRFTVK